MNMFYLAAQAICSKLIPVWTIFGYIIFAIKVVVPLLLIVSGMITMAKAIMEKKEDDIKKAQNLLIKKLIAAVIVYLVITVTGIIVNLVSSTDWKTCTKCSFSPFDENCYIVDEGTGSATNETGGVETKH